MDTEQRELVAIWERESTHGPQPGQRFQHYKGGFYKIEARALYKDTRVSYVTYRSELLGVCWLLSVDEFMARICQEDGTVIQRFTQVPEQEIPCPSQ